MVKKEAKEQEKVAKNEVQRQAAAAMEQARLFLERNKRKRKKRRKKKLLEPLHSPCVAVLVVDNGSCMILPGFYWWYAGRAVFPSFVDRPRTLGILFGGPEGQFCSADVRQWVSRAPCIRQSLVRCLVCLMSSGFGFWEMASWETCVFCVPGSTVDDVHASLYGAFCSLSHTFHVRMDLGSWSGSHLVVFASRSTGKIGFYWR